MILSRVLSLSLAVLFLGTCVARVSAGEVVAPKVLKELRQKMEIGGSGLTIDSAIHSDVPGLIEVQFADGPLVYATEDGAFFLIGDLFSVGSEGYVNLSEKRRDTDREKLLAGVAQNDMIIFPAQGKTRAYINVFTDVTCFYCQKLHKEVPELNRRGVEVRYLAYPRSGLGSEGFRQLASAWCAGDRQGTLTRLKNRETVAENVCPGNPVAAQYDLGQQVGVRGTPAIVTPSGQMIPGYRPVDDLIAVLGLE